MKSIIYWHPGIYELAMRFLYGNNFHGRYRAIVDLIPAGAEIIDVCCGDCYIYFNFLKDKNVNYLGLDINPAFITAAKKRGARVELFDLIRDRLPGSDYILMQASLYHFIPEQRAIIQKILDSAGKMAIISEPVVNLSASENIFLSGISKILTRAGTDHSNERLKRETLLELFDEFGATSQHEIKGGREIVGVFDKGRHG